jgi:hypothetical protein
VVVVECEHCADRMTRVGGCDASVEHVDRDAPATLIGAAAEGAADVGAEPDDVGSSDRAEPRSTYPATGAGIVVRPAC